jgi:hypothetical protein
MQNSEDCIWRINKYVSRMKYRHDCIHDELLWIHLESTTHLESEKVSYKRRTFVLHMQSLLFCVPHGS